MLDWWKKPARGSYAQDYTPSDETLLKRLRSHDYPTIQVLGCSEIFERRD